MVVGDARQRLQWLLVGTPGSKVGEVAVVGPARSIWSDRSVRRSTRSRPRDSGEHDEIVEESPPTQRRTARRSEQPPVSQPAAGEEPVENAPRTHRLDQVTANNLRAGWLAARRRGEVTISQQEYAGRIIALGLAEEARQLAE
jgi:hypothetical protein